MWALETSLPNSPKSHFGLVNRKKIISQCLATSWNISFSTSPNSNFGLVKRQNRTFKFHLTAWLFFCPLEKSRIFSWSRSRKWLQRVIRQPESSLFRLHPNLILGKSSCRKCVRSALQPLEKSLYWIHQSYFGLVQRAKIGWSWFSGCHRLAHPLSQAIASPHKYCCRKYQQVKVGRHN